jgi:phosphoribosylanthranilate isomerase
MNIKKNKTLVKICGITSIEDRDMCLSEGADLIGFNIYPKSKRYVEPEKLKLLLNNNVENDNVKKCAVFVGVNKTVSEWSEIAEEYKPAYLQLHGDEDMDFLKDIKKEAAITGSGVKVIKKVCIDEAAMFEEYLEYTDYLLCDSACVGYGGSGQSFNWDKLNKLNVNTDIRKRLFIAGGISPENIKHVLEYDVLGVDIASGAESYPAKKDVNKVRKIIEEVRNYDK